MVQWFANHLYRQHEQYLRLTKQEILPSAGRDSSFGARVLPDLATEIAKSPGIDDD